MPNNIDGDIWYWYHSVSEPYYHIQLTIKYRKGLLNEGTERIILEVTKGFKERYAIEVSHIGFDKNHVHFLCKFLPKYSGGQVIKLVNCPVPRAQGVFNDFYSSNNLSCLLSSALPCPSMYFSITFLSPLPLTVAK